MSLIFRKRPGLTTRLFAGEAFVISRHGIECLSPTAAIAWQLLDQPLSKSDLVEQFTLLYPDVGRDRLATDIAALLNHLVRSRLLKQISAPAARKAARRHSTGR